MAFPDNWKEEISTNLDEKELYRLYVILDSEKQKGITWLSNSMFAEGGFAGFKWKGRYFQLEEMTELVTALYEVDSSGAKLKKKENGAIV